MFSETPADSSLVSISGMFHLDFTYAAAWWPLMSRLGLTRTDSIESSASEIVNRYSVEFFRQHSNRQPAPLSTRDIERYPQVDFRLSVVE